MYIYKVRTKWNNHYEVLHIFSGIECMFNKYYLWLSFLSLSLLLSCNDDVSCLAGRLVMWYFYWLQKALAINLALHFTTHLSLSRIFTVPK